MTGNKNKGKNRRAKARRNRRILNRYPEFFTQVGNLNKIGYGAGLSRVSLKDKGDGDV